MSSISGPRVKEFNLPPELRMGLVLIVLKLSMAILLYAINLGELYGVSLMRRSFPALRKDWRTLLLPTKIMLSLIATSIHASL
jgi:hypothetical protein